MGVSELKELIIYLSIIFMMAPASLLIYVYIYNKRKKKHADEKQQLQSQFSQELLKTQNEIQEQTLTHISRELHDNVTQVLSFVKLNLAMAANATREESLTMVNESRQLVAQAITDLRDLSKSLSFEHISQLGLVKTIGFEVERISKSKLVNVDLKVTGEAYPLGNQRELVLFRIFQEALNNVLKHSRAKRLSINLEYSGQLFTLTIADDGHGFSPDAPASGGSGLRNMMNRAALVGAVAVIDSAPGKGCCIKITIDPLLQQFYANGTYPDSSG